MTNAITKHAEFIPFLACGNPDLDTTAELICALDSAGADRIILGIPFSDPTLEHPVIQEANVLALKNGTTTDKIFEMVDNLRRKEGLEIPLAFRTYANVVYAYGIERFAEKCSAINVDALLVTDLPFEEQEEFEIACNKFNVSLIKHIAPTNEERINTIASHTSNFLMCFSEPKANASFDDIVNANKHMVTTAQKASDLPCYVELGNAQLEDISTVLGNANGIVVGNALALIIEEHPENAVSQVATFAQSVGEIVHSA